MLTDLLGYFKRNLHTMNSYQQQKTKRELQEIIRLIDRNSKTA